VFHGWNAVGIVRCQRDEFNGFIRGQVSNVDTYPHIHALLLKIRIEIAVGERLSRGVGNPLGVQHETTELQHAEPNGKQILVRQFVQPLVVGRELLP